jgi:hypothetical protein
MFRIKSLIAILAVALLTLTNCHTAKYYVESGDYDGAIDYCVDHLKGHNKKKNDLVKGLELAFQKATERDMRAADALIAEGRSDNWARVYQIHQQIHTRQDKVNPLIPLKSKDGYEAKFLFVNIEKLEQESRTNAAEHLYQKAVTALEQGRRGDKDAARDAYNILEDLENKYFRDYKNKEAMQQEASIIGVVHVLFEVKNETNRLLPRDFNQRVLAISKRDLDSKWRSYDFEPATGVKYDYKAIFRLNNVDISPERIRERSYTDEREIQDGWEYVYDTRGNVKKDSSGNDIKRPRNVLVRANVLEVFQTKAARITGQVDIFDTGKKALLDYNPLATEVLFEHYASTFAGDARALSDKSRCRIGNRPAPFPADEDMLVQAADRLVPGISNGLSSSSVLR